MANYYCAARTNYFKVKDMNKFLAWAKQYEVKVIDDAHKEGNPSEVRVGLISENPDSGGWPSYDMDTGSDIDFVSLLSEHLADDEVAIFVEAGSEKMRYVVGSAIAVNSAGDVLGVNIDDIYGLVKCEWGVKPTLAEY